MWNTVKLFHSEIERKSECTKRQVGAVIFDIQTPNLASTQQIISWGYNYALLGKKCTDNILSNHRQFSEIFEIHAEIAAINKLVKINNVNIYQNLSILVTCSPCNACMKSLLDLNFKNIYYYDYYEKSKDLLELARKYVNIKQVNR